MIDEIRVFPETWDGTGKVHESVFKAAAVLTHLEIMLERHDSVESMKEFIEDAYVESKRKIRHDWSNIQKMIIFNK